MKTLPCAFFLLLSFILPANAVQVYPGCAAPGDNSHLWYIDPVNGNDATGTGSQTAPWRTLQAVVSSVNGASPLLATVPYHHRDSTGAWTTSPNPNAPIQPGDEIFLMSGNYGDVSIGVYGAAISNSAFVTIAAAPGQTPVLSTLLLRSTNNWAFNGLKVESLKTSTNTNPLVYVEDQGPSYPTSNIIFENMTISSQDDISSWSQAYWLANGRDGFSARGSSGGANTTCVSVTGSRITNVNNGATLFAGNLLFSNNQIDHFGDDGIDYAASNLTITKNYIHDNNNLGDGNHEDAMQGQIGVLAAGATLNYFSNILIDSNTIVRQVDPDLAFPTYLQGIDAFDEDWTNVTVTNNVIITSACWGIGYGSLHDSVIANNTVLNDGLIYMPGNCAPVVSIYDATHEGPSSSNSVLRNNLTTAISVYNLDTGVEMDHNVCVSANGKGWMSYYEDGVIGYYSAPGTYGDGNIIDSGGAASEFINFNPATLTYDVMLAPGAQAIGAGSATDAPTVDILDVPRRNPYDAGAYAYPR